MASERCTEHELQQSILRICNSCKIATGAACYSGEVYQRALIEVCFARNRRSEVVTWVLYSSSQVMGGWVFLMV